MIDVKWRHEKRTCGAGKRASSHAIIAMRAQVASALSFARAFCTLSASRTVPASVHRLEDLITLLLLLRLRSGPAGSLPRYSSAETCLIPPPLSLIK